MRPARDRLSRLCVVVVVGERANEAPKTPRKMEYAYAWAQSETGYARRPRGETKGCTGDACCRMEAAMDGAHSSQRKGTR